jgi:uncharacterized membrane protein YccF (DUF307 family)
MAVGLWLLAASCHARLKTQPYTEVEVEVKVEVKVKVEVEVEVQQVVFCGECYWLLVIGYWLLVFGYWFFVAIND